MYKAIIDASVVLAPNLLDRILEHTNKASELPLQVSPHKANKQYFNNNKTPQKQRKGREATKLNVSLTAVMHKTKSKEALSPKILSKQPIENMPPYKYY